MIHSNYFITYEELVEYLDEKTGFSPPRIIEGQKRFLGKFNKWFTSFDDTETSVSSWRCVFPDPKLNISYPYPIDEITVACSLAEEANNVQEAQMILNDFHLDSNLSKRQTITLSGGELLLLSFAKTKSLEKITETIYICTPTQWLHKSKYFILENLINSYSQNGKNVHILMLEGETLNLQSSNFTIEDPNPGTDSLPWTISFKNLSKAFDEQIFPKETPSKEIKYLPIEFNEELQSPTLITGDNGLGKSVFVKLLSNILTPTSGKVSIRCLGNEGFARVLMQDSLGQLFGETTDDHLNRVFKYDKERGKRSKETYSNMLTELRSAIKDNASLRQKKLTATDSDFAETVLQVKFALIAERLESSPPLLILDEPDWCLSMPITKIFIQIVVKFAHKCHIPVLIITHLPEWYQGTINSVLEFKIGSQSNEVLISKMIVNE